MQIEVWSDFACPWCALGLARLRGGLGVLRARRRRSASCTAPSSSIRGRRRTPRAHQRRGRRRQVRHRPGAGARSARAADCARRRGRRGVRLRPGAGSATPSMPIASPRPPGARRARTRCVQRPVRGDTSPRGGCSRIMTSSATCAAVAGLDDGVTDEVLAGDAYALEVRSDEAAARERDVTGVPVLPHQRRLADARAPRTSRRWGSCSAGPGHVSAIEARISSTISTVVLGCRKAKRATVSPSQLVGVTKPIWSCSRRADHAS